MKKKFFSLFADVNSFVALILVCSVSFILVYSVVNAEDIDNQARIHELNAQYVFINLGPAGLPDNQGYMVDFVQNDTIYLIPNTEEAGY